MANSTWIELEFVPLGSTGIRTIERQFGTWRFGTVTEAGNVEIDEERTYRLPDAYESAACRFIDTADVYGGGEAEEWIRNWLEGRDRERFTAASEIDWGIREGDTNSMGTNRKNRGHRVDAILDRLDPDDVDVLYVHRWDDATSTCETMRTLTRFVDEGEVHYLGASTRRPNAWRVVHANDVAR